MKQAPAILLLAACGRAGFDLQSDAAGGVPDSVEPFDAAIADYVLRCPFDDPAPATAITCDTRPGKTASPRCGGASCPTSVQGQFASAFNFEGDGLAGMAIDPPSLLTPPLTVSIWVRIDPSATSTMSLISKPFSATTQQNALNLLSTFDNYVQYESTPDGATFHYQTHYVGLRDGAWHHVAAVFDGTNKHLYVDANGAPMMTASVADGAGPILLGFDLDDGMTLNAVLDGDLDELRIYDRALSPAEIALLAAP